MKILPVLDLMGGQVVRGVAGERERYQPVSSCLCNSSEPLEVANAFRERLGLTELYIADLDAIQKNSDRPAACIGCLKQAEIRCMVDAGVQNHQQASRILEAGADKVIFGLETLPDMRLLETVCAEFGADRVVFSLDLMKGKPLGNSTFQLQTPLQIARSALECGIRQMIVLDLHQVGQEQGLSTLPLCRELLQSQSDVEVITGGGVRNLDDLLQLKEADISGALVASALHSGAIGRTELEQL